MEATIDLASSQPGLWAGNVATHFVFEMVLTTEYLRRLGNSIPSARLPEAKFINKC